MCLKRCTCQRGNTVQECWPGMPGCGAMAACSIHGPLPLMTPTPYFIPNFEVRSVLLLAALTVGTALVSQAQTAGQDNPPVRAIPVAQEVEAAFQRADVNRDGRLTRQEAARFPVIEQNFDQIDTDRDQAISPAEFQAALKT